MYKVLTAAMVLMVTLMLVLSGCSNDNGSNDSGSGAKQPDQQPSGSSSR